MRWIVLGDSEGAFGTCPLPRDADTALIERGSIVAEFDLPPEWQSGELLHFSDRRGWQRHLFIDLMPEGSLRLVHRHAGGAVHLSLPIGRSDRQSTLRLTYCWDAPRRICRLVAERPDENRITVTYGRNPLPLPVADAFALASDRVLVRRHSGLLWLGVSSGIEPAGLAPAMVATTPVMTPRGLRPLATLAPGDLVQTWDAGPQPVLWVGRFDLPARGSYMPIRLRAPYFGNRADLIVAPNQRIALRGAEVEYLFGEDEVLVAARWLVDGRAAVHERDRARVRYASLLLAPHSLLQTDGCLQESLHIADLATRPTLMFCTALALLDPSHLPVHDRPVRRALQFYEAATLMALRSQARNPLAA